jgi:peptide/nickel transport system substrate-binding protein
VPFKVRFIAIAVAIGWLAIHLVSGSALAQKSKDTLRVPWILEFRGIDYYSTPGPDTTWTQTAIADTLIAFNEENQRHEGLLAKSWKVLDDVTYEFELRDGITWHDGTRFSADDVVSMFRWLIDPEVKLRYKHFYSWIANVEKIGPNIVRITSRAPHAAAITRFGTGTEIFPAHIFGKLPPGDRSEFGIKPVGTGMYRALKVEPSKIAVLERNPRYGHGGAAKPASNIGRIEIPWIPDPSTREAQYLSGNIDIVYLDNLDAAKSLASRTQSELSMPNSVGYVYAAIDARGRSGLKPLQDPRVRKALLMAIDRNKIANFLLHEPISTMESLCLKLQEGCGYSSKPPMFDPAAARELLAQAGYSNGFELEITALSEPGINAANIILPMLKQIGITATLDPIKVLTSYFKKQGEGKIQMLVSPWPGGTMADVEGTIGYLLSPGPNDNFGDSEIHQLAQENLRTLDSGKRKEIGTRLFDAVMDRGYAMPLVASRRNYVHTKDLALPGFILMSMPSVSQYNWR